MAFVPQAAHLVALFFLFTGFILAALGAVLLHALATGNRTRAGKVLRLGIAWSAIYAAVLLGFSLLSKERVLAVGETKYFCELDCHLAYSVESVLAAPTLGAGEHAVQASGTFYVVKLRTLFDAETTSSRRAADMPLRPNLRWAVVVDEQGRRYATSLAGMQALTEPAGQNVPLTQALIPGESYQTTLVFDLPADARHPRLLLTDPLPVNWFLIGHENSFLHKKVFFRLEGHSTSGATD
jgi:hypothetical protein